MKIAKIGYGREGQGVGRSDGGYIYLVSDTVRTGDVLQPIATNWKSGRKFVTTGKVNHSYKETSVLGQEAKQKAQANHDITIQEKIDKFQYDDKYIPTKYERQQIAQQGQDLNIARAYRGKELGVEGVPFSPTTSKQTPMQYSERQLTEQQAITRGKQVEQSKKEHPQAKFTQEAQTFEEKYIKPYMEAQRK